MAPVANNVSDLNARLRTPADYASERSALFGGEQSVRWFIKANRKRLLDAGALLMIAGRVMVDPEPFDRVVYELARERANAVLHGQRNEAGQVAA